MTSISSHYSQSFEEAAQAAAHDKAETKPEDEHAGPSAQMNKTTATLHYKLAENAHVFKLEYDKPEEVRAAVAAEQSEEAEADSLFLLRSPLRTGGRGI